LDQHYHTTLEDLLVKHLLQEATPEERQKVDQWLAAGPANQRHYDQLKLIWEKSRQFTLPDIQGEEDIAWQKFRQKLHEPPSIPARHRIATHPLRWVGAAILLFTLVRAGIYISHYYADKTTWQTIASQNAVRTDTLPDRSIITLNKQSSLARTETFNDKERAVELKGEAFFRVTPDKHLPFRVLTNEAVITVLGTSFNVRTDPDKTTILVESGRVSVHTRYGNIQLDSGETITLNHYDHKLQKQTAPAQLYKYYQPRVFECKDVTLQEFVDALNKAYGDSVVIGNPRLRNLPITTTFHNEDLHRILDVISTTLDIHFQQTGPKYILK